MPARKKPAKKAPAKRPAKARTPSKEAKEAVAEKPKAEALVVLEGLQAKLARTLNDDRTKAGAVPGLSRELRVVTVELERLRKSAEASERGNFVDELAARRRQRRSGTGNPPPSARRGQSGRGR